MLLAASTGNLNTVARTQRITWSLTRWILACSLVSRESSCNAGCGFLHESVTRPSIAPTSTAVTPHTCYFLHRHWKFWGAQTSNMEALSRNTGPLKAHFMALYYTGAHVSSNFSLLKYHKPIWHGSNRVTGTAVFQQRSTGEYLGLQA